MDKNQVGLFLKNINLNRAGRALLGLVGIVVLAGCAAISSVQVDPGLDPNAPQFEKLGSSAKGQPAFIANPKHESREGIAYFLPKGSIHITATRSQVLVTNCPKAVYVYTNIYPTNGGTFTNVELYTNIVNILHSYSITTNHVSYATNFSYGTFPGAQLSTFTNNTVTSNSTAGLFGTNGLMNFVTMLGSNVSFPVTITNIVPSLSTNTVYALVAKLGSNVVLNLTLSTNPYTMTQVSSTTTVSNQPATYYPTDALVTIYSYTETMNEQPYVTTNFTYTVNVGTTYSADRTKLFLAQPQMDWFHDDSESLSVDANGLLSSVGTTNNDQSGNIVVNLAQAAIESFELAGGLPVPLSPAGGPPSPTGPVIPSNSQGNDYFAQTYALMREAQHSYILSTKQMDFQAMHQSKEAAATLFTAIQNSRIADSDLLAAIDSVNVAAAGNLLPTLIQQLRLAIDAEVKSSQANRALQKAIEGFESQINSQDLKSSIKAEAQRTLATPVSQPPADVVKSRSNTTPLQNQTDNGLDKMALQKVGGLAGLSAAERGNLVDSALASVTDANSKALAAAQAAEVAHSKILSQINQGNLLSLDFSVGAYDIKEPYKFAAYLLDPEKRLPLTQSTNDITLANWQKLPSFVNEARQKEALGLTPTDQESVRNSIACILNFSMTNGTSPNDYRRSYFLATRDETKNLNAILILNTQNNAITHTARQLLKRLLMEDTYRFIRRYDSDQDSISSGNASLAYPASIDVTFDPFDRDQFRAARLALANAGIVIENFEDFDDPYLNNFYAKWQSTRVDDSFNGGSSGIFYRPPIPYPIRIRDANSNEVTATVLLPNKAPILNLPLDKAAFVQAVSSVTLTNGFISSYSFSKPSSMYALSAIPLTLLSDITASITNILQLRLNIDNMAVSQQTAVNSLMTQRLNAVQAQLTSQNTLMAAQYLAQANQQAAQNSLLNQQFSSTLSQLNNQSALSTAQQGAAQAAQLAALTNSIILQTLENELQNLRTNGASK